MTHVVADLPNLLPLLRQQRPFLPRHGWCRMVLHIIANRALQHAKFRRLPGRFAGAPAPVEVYAESALAAGKDGPDSLLKLPVVRGQVDAEDLTNPVT